MNSPIPNTDLCFTIIMGKIIPNVRINNDLNLVFNPYHNNFDFINDFFYRSFLYKTKFEVYKEFNDNPFLNNEKKMELNKYFNTAQRIYYLCKNFYHKKTFCKHQHDSGNIDLFHNSLDLCNERYKLPLICDNIIYNFNVNDIIRIINTGLIYSPDLFPEPKLPSNPWTNMRFSKTNLYNIYFHIIRNNILLPKLFYSLFRCDWDIDKFLCQHEGIIRDISIKHYYDDISVITKYNDIIIMLRKYRVYVPNLSIHPRFSKNEIVSKLEHLLTLHLTREYTHNPTNCLFAKRKLKRALKKLNLENPQFGRINLTTRRSVGENPFPSEEVENHIEPGTQLSNHQFYTSINLLSNSIPNYARVEDLLDHITESNVVNQQSNDGDEIEPQEHSHTFQQMHSIHETTEEVENEDNEIHAVNIYLHEDDDDEFDFDDNDLYDTDSEPEIN